MTRRHDLDPVSLTFGFLFTALGLLFVVGRADDAFRLRWIWPLLLLVLGTGILLDIAQGRGRTVPASGELDAAPEPEAQEAEAQEAEAQEAVDDGEHPL